MRTIKLKTILTGTVNMGIQAETTTLKEPTMTAFKTLFFGSDNRYTTWLLRLSLGILMLPHGIQKTLGWWGGYGFTNTMNAFTAMMGIPAPLALAAILAESAGALLLIFGLFTRLSAFAIGVTMLVAALKVHWAGGFFMPKGIEFFIPVIAIAIVLVIQGGGKWALDNVVSRRMEN
jgi:putative oxidoreductase